MTLILKKNEICPRKDFCLFSRDCKGVDGSRPNIFTCNFDSDQDDQIKEEERRAPIKIPVFKVPVCSLRKQ